jgi:hypothetical protein
LRRSRALGPSGLYAGEISLATNIIRIELHAANDPDFGLLIAFEEDAGILRAEASWSGEASEPSDDQRRTWTIALLGLFTLSGVESTSLLGDPAADVLVEPASTTPGEVWPSTARPGSGSGSGPGQTVHRLTISWKRWAAVWEAEDASTLPNAVAPDHSSELSTITDRA